MSSDAGIRIGLRLLLLMLVGFTLVSPAAAQGASETDNAPRSFAGERPRPVAVANGQPVVEPVRLPEPVESGQFLSPTGLTPTLKILLLMTVLSLAPSLIIMTSCFIRFVIVFGLLRQALGTQQLPPTQVITVLSLFMTLFVMMPVWEQAWSYGIEPYVDERPIPNLQQDEDPLKRVLLNTMEPIQSFMSQQIERSGGKETVWMLVDMRRPDPDSEAGRNWHEPEFLSDVSPPIIVTAYMLTELKTAFLIGFQIYLPFLIIDMVVATVLTGMGMMMLPPTLISVPFKILLFVLIDGWTLTVRMLLESVAAATS